MSRFDHRKRRVCALRAERASRLSQPRQRLLDSYGQRFRGGSEGPRVGDDTAAGHRRRGSKSFGGSRHGIPQTSSRGRDIRTAADLFLLDVPAVVDVLDVVVGALHGCRGWGLACD